jgi:hypothetical protein
VHAAQAEEATELAAVDAAVAAPPASSSAASEKASLPPAAAECGAGALLHGAGLATRAEPAFARAAASLHAEAPAAALSCGAGGLQRSCVPKERPPLPDTDTSGGYITDRDVEEAAPPQLQQVETFSAKKKENPTVLTAAAAAAPEAPALIEKSPSKKSKV